MEFKSLLQLKELTGSNEEDLVRIGFGTFVDKVTSPQTELLPYRLEIPFDNAGTAVVLFQLI